MASPPVAKVVTLAVASTFVVNQKKQKITKKITRSVFG
jgi:hypothetical protein